MKRCAAAFATPAGLPAPATVAELRGDPDRHCEEWDTTHDVLRDRPERVLRFLDGS